MTPLHLIVQYMRIVGLPPTTEENPKQLEKKQKQKRSGFCWQVGTNSIIKYKKVLKKL